MPRRKQNRNATGRRGVKRSTAKQVLSHVVSLRVSDEELAMLYRMGKERAKTVSDLMREALECLQNSQCRTCIPA